MDATTVDIDLAKNVFEIALADERRHIVERQRLIRARFDRFFINRPACRIVMEACGSAHHHARRLGSQGHDVVLESIHDLLGDLPLGVKRLAGARLAVKGDPRLPRHLRQEQ
jgi:hypothetical protein